MMIRNWIVLQEHFENSHMLVSKHFDTPAEPNKDKTPVLSVVCSV